MSGGTDDRPEIAPETCTTMAELRAVIDRIDDDLVSLMAARQACIDRAAEIKASEGLPAHIPERVSEVLDRVRARAQTTKLDPDLAVLIWRSMIDWSIMREETAMSMKKKD
ncbi:chorismate mutase [Meridianimarinicoccus sp. RP-17]|uniref:chorismate mutase n=1 Tax=Meridianimarinicoccus zhengii TaxID=2056810 RepID=UPI000DAE40F8|nr:chorismate mutase [Phycocomes zhengii]